MSRLLYGFLLLFFWLPANAQQRFLFNRYSTNDGLLSNHVFCTVQDKIGYLWIGTANGLQRFDGKRFLSVPLKGIKPSSTYVQSLMVDKDGKLIVLSGPALYTGSEVGLLDPLTLHYQKLSIQPRIKGAPQGIYHLGKDSEGNIYLGASAYGLYELDRQKMSFTDSRISKALPPNWGVNFIYEDRKTGNYWITSDSGLALYDRRREAIYTHQFNPLQIPILKENIKEPEDFKIDDQRRYWILDFINEKRPNVLCYDEATSRFLPQPAIYPDVPSNKYELLRILFTRNKKIWASGFHALLNYDPGTNRFYQYKDMHVDDYGIRFTLAYHILEDREGLLWVSTSDGLYYFNPDLPAVSNYIFSDTVDHNVYTLLQPSKGEVWAGTFGQGIYIFDTSLNESASHPLKKIEVNHAWILNLFRSEQSPLVYVTTIQGEIFNIDPSSKKIIKWTKPKFSKGFPINGITGDKQGNIWFADANRNLFQLPAGQTLEENHLKIKQKLPVIAYKLVTDNKGRLYAGTREIGLLVIDPVNNRIIGNYTQNNSTNKGLSSNNVVDIIPLNDSLLYLNDGALDLLNTNTGSVKHLGEEAGVRTNSIRGMALDKDGVLWFTNTQGMFSYSYKDNKFSKFERQYGFYNVENFRTAVTTESGKLFFGGDNIMSCFYPDRLKHTNEIPPVALTEIRLFNRSLLVDSLQQLSQVTFNYNHNSLTFFFSTLSYLQTDKLSFYYRLKGANPDWIKADASLSVNYSLLPPGSYTFEVYSENGKGYRSKATYFSFTIRPPFWLSWWFITLCCVAVAYTIHFIYKQRINRLLAIQQVRQRVARDLHDDMGSTLSSISILSSMAKDKLDKDPARISEYINKISDNSTRMMEAIDYIVWSINPSNDSMAKVVARMREFATEVLEAKNIDLHFKVDERLEQVKLDMEARRDLFLIYKEAVNNSAKYSNASEVHIELKLTSGRLQLLVSDNGGGFQKGEIKGGGNGLGNMQKRAQSLKGILHIDSEIGKGTTVSLMVPAS